MIFDFSRAAADRHSPSTTIAAPKLIPLLLLLAGLVAGGAPSFAQDPQPSFPRPVADDRDADEDYRTLWRRGEYREALARLNRELIDIAPAVPSDMRYHRAQLNFATGRVDAAIEDMRWFAERYPEPAYSVELALMYRYRGMPLLYEKWLDRAAGQTQGTRWYNRRRRSQNFAAVGRVLELSGSNPKTILSAHYGRAFEVFRDLEAPAYVGAGDLAFRNKGYSIAEGYYLQALEKDPDNQPALAGLLECYWKSNDERMAEVAERLEKLNPDHPRLNAMKVEKLLEKLEIEAALEIIDAQLAINPVSHRFRSLKATAKFLDDDIEAMNRIVDAVLEYNPVRSEIYRTLGRFASRHYRFKQGAEFQEKALFLDANDYEARALYTLDLMRLGREQEGREELERAFQADPFNVTLYNLLQLMDTLEGFETIERGAFVLRIPKHEAPILAEAALDLLDEALVYLESRYDYEIEKPVLIEMFDNHDDFMVRSVGLPGNAGHLGICFGKVVTMDTPSVRPKGSSNWRSVLWHEFAHVMTLQKTNNRMPRWLSEGLSVYEEEQYAEAWQNRLDPQFLPILTEEGIPSLRDIDGYFTAPKSGMHLMYGYFMAGEFVKFYEERYGWDAMVATLASIGDGVEAELALVEHSGVPFDELDTDFHAYLQNRFEPFDNLPGGAKEEPGFLSRIAQQIVGGGNEPEPQNEPPSSPFTDAMQAGQEAFEAQDYAGAEIAWKKALALFPDYRGPDAPLRRLVALYALQGREGEHREALERLMESSPQELEASHALLKLHREDGNWERAAEVADWILGIDPYDPTVYRTYVEALAETDRRTDALDALGVLTHIDSAKATDYRMQRAQILHSMEDWDPAKREVLMLLEEMPHYWEAQELLLKIADASPSEPMAEIEPDDTPSGAVAQ